jgi:hypothetical protein
MGREWVEAVSVRSRWGVSVSGGFSGRVNRDDVRERAVRGVILEPAIGRAGGGYGVKQSGLTSIWVGSSHSISLRVIGW